MTSFKKTTANIGIANSGAGHWSNQQRQICCNAVWGLTNKAKL